MVKKKCNYDFSFNYMEEVYFPTLRQRWFLLHADPVWYRFILGGIVVEALIIVFMTPFQIRMFSHYHMFFIRIQQIFNSMYAFDLLLCFRQKFFFKYRYPYPNPIRRPAPVMIMEIVSVLPFELLFSNFNQKDKLEYSYDERRFYMGLITLHILKLARFFYHVYNNRRDLHNEFRTRILEMVVILVVFCGFIVHILHMLEVLVTTEEIYDGFQMLTCNVAGRGAVLDDSRIKSYDVYRYELITVFFSILMWTVAVYPTTCFMILSFIENHQHRHAYSYLIRLFKTKIAPKYSLTAERYKMMLDYFQANWKLRGGFSKMEFDFAQKSLQVEICMDTCWPAFKHSMLFRNVEFYILRSMADKFDRLIRMEGEYVFSRTKKKLGLVYIAQGVIEILSTENNESGILCLTAGTCVGEASLIIPHVSPVNFRCKTVCLLFELTRDKFMYFQKNFPTEYKQLQSRLVEQLTRVRKIQAYNAQFNQDDVERKRLIWLKYHLHNMMGTRSAYNNDHEQTNIYLRHELQDEVNRQKHLFHIYECLDKLAIRERTFTDIDLVFIRSTCPWILKACSPITNTWEYFVVIVSVICSLAVSYGFCVSYTSTARFITGACHVVFVFDIVVLVITPISPESEARTLGAVLAERLRSKGFILDIVSVYYWRMIAFVMDTNLPWFELFKLVKLWRVWKFFERWGDRFLVNTLLFTTILAGTAYIALIYFLSCFFTLTKITDYLMSPTTIQFATGAGLPFEKKENVGSSESQRYIYILANALSLFVYLSVTAMMCSSFYLHYISRFRIVSLINSLSQCIKYKENSWLWLRMDSYFNVLRHDTDVQLSGGNISMLYELPVYFEIVMKSNVHFEALKKLQMFKGHSDEMMINLLVHTETFTCYKRSIIINRGVIYKEVFVLIKGECRTLANCSYMQTRLYEPLNFLENCYNYPSVTSTIALTDCLVLKFNFNAFLHLLSENPTEYKAFKKTLDLMKEENHTVLMRFLYEPIMLVRSLKKRPNMTRFKYFAKKDSYAEFDYHVPFDKIRPFDFVKYFLMRTTFYPGGHFIITYEIIHGVIAFVSACTFTIPAINVGAYTLRTRGYPMMLALDLFAVFDIYIRMHVQYYSQDGLLVTHPLRTFKYYLSHGFFIDCLAVFPFDIFPMKVHFRVILNALHAIQLHRITAIRVYYSTSRHYYILNTVSLICYILFAANFISGLIFAYDCYAWNSEEQFPVPKCKSFQYEKIEAHFHILFLVISSLQCSGMTGPIDITKLDGALSIIISVLTVMGTLAHIFHKAYIFSSYITSIIDKYKFVTGVRRLLRLLVQGTPENARYLCKEVSNYYDLHWDNVGSQNLAYITSNMINALRRDILFKWYGDNLVVHSIFTENITDTTLFIKNIFLVGKPMVLPKGGYATTINDVDEYIYLLNHGSVDVVGPDGGKMLELTEGAIFGNFSGMKHMRIKNSIVANVNTDLIYVSGGDFFQIIAYFPNIRTHFQMIVEKTAHYIQSTKQPEPKLKMTFEEYVKAVNRYGILQVISYIHLYLVCYAGLCLELYQIAVGEMHIIYLCVQYFLDALHLIREYLKFRLPYKDLHRIPIFEKKKVIARQIANRREMFVMVVTVIYLDLFLVLPLVIFGRYSFDDLTYVFTALRLNRLFRIYYVKTSFETSEARVSQAFTNLAKWMYVIYWFILSHQVVAAITAILDTLVTDETNNLIQHIPIENIRNIRYLSSKEKLEMYLRYLFFANLIHINTCHKNYEPNSIIFHIYIIILFMYRMVMDSVLLCRFFEAMVDIVVLRRLYLRGASFLKFYLTKSFGTFIVKDRVIENAKHAWTKSYYKSDHVLSMVCPRYLREVILHSLYGYLLRRHPVFSHTHIDFLRQLGVHMRRVIYPCNFVVVYQREMRKCMFFIHKGSVSAFNVDFGYQDIELSVLGKGDSFGFRQGLAPLQEIYEYTYITTSHCEILELEWDSWKHLLPFFPATKEYIFDEAEKYRTTTLLPFNLKEVIKDYW